MFKIRKSPHVCPPVVTIRVRVEGGNGTLIHLRSDELYYMTKFMADTEWYPIVKVISTNGHLVIVESRA